MLRAVKELDIDPRDPGLRIEVNGCDVATDALMAMTGASFASGRIVVLPDSGPRIVSFLAAGRQITESIE